MAFLVTGPQGAGKTTVAGRAEMTEAASDEGFAQLRLRSALAHHTAQEYEQAGFTAVVEDVVAARAGRRHAPWVYRLLAEATPRVGTWIENGRLTPEETAAAILRR